MAMTISNLKNVKRWTEKRKIESHKNNFFHEKFFKCPQKDSLSKIEESKVSSENRNSHFFLPLGASECAKNAIFGPSLVPNIQRTFALILAK